MRDIEFEAGESIIRQSHAFLVLDGKTPGKNGTLTLTNRRLIWTPIRFPIPRAEPQVVPLNQIEDCRIGSRTFLTLPLLIRSRGHDLAFYLGGNPLRTLVKPVMQEQWVEDVSKAMHSWTPDA